MKKYSYGIGLLFFSFFCFLQTAEPAPSSQTCIKPITIPDKWMELSVPMDNFFTSLDKQGTRLPNPDGYFAGSGYSGRDRGLQLVLTASDGSSIASNAYYPLTLPDNNGGSDYRSNFSVCSPAAVNLGDRISVEPGNKTGPTKQGVQDLIKLDPGAYWNTSTNSVAGSNWPVSPRIMTVMLFNPADYEVEKQAGRNTDFQIAGFIGLFVEAVTPDGIVVRLVPTSTAVCGDSICDSAGGESCSNCASDCPPPPNTICL